jgi:predicted phage terminase large subunit-like protein
LLLYPRQVQFLDSGALFRAFVGGRAAGKSFVGAYDLLRRAKAGRLYLFAAPTYPMLRDATLRSFLHVARLTGVGVELQRAEMTAHLSNGADVLFRSADDPDRLRGPNLSGAWLDEASVMASEAYDVVLASLRQFGEQGWLTATFTPAGLAHWTYDRFGRPDAPPDTEVVHARTEENPFNPPGFAATVARQYDDMLALRELGGEFVDVEGSEWPASYFTSDVWFEDWPAASGLPVTVVALDPSRGKESKAGDYAAYVVVRLDRSDPPLLWVDAEFSRADVYAVVARGVELARGFPGCSLVVETNIGQELLVGEFDRAMTAGGVLIPVDAMENYQRKDVRIRRLGPYLARKRVRFRNSPGGRLLATQLQQFPHGRYDDGPDALEMAVRRLERMYGEG